MEPVHLIIALAVVVVVFFLWKNRERFPVAVSSSLMQILDAIVVGYVIYLIVATVFDFSAYYSWNGAARILLFSAKPDGAQYFAIFAGCLMGFLRIFQSEGQAGHKTNREYRGGRRIWCHRSALIVANSLLAKRADEAKLHRPQHLAADESYPQPNDESELDPIVPLEDVETNRAVEPYQSEPGEYSTALWGMLRVPYENTNLHFLVVGAPGSGKTLMIHGLMKSVLPRIKTDKNFRAFVYDDKPDFMPFARMWEIDQYVWNLDPFDANGFAWDIASDVASKAEAMQVASVLAPVDPHVPDPYWQQATQSFLGAVLLNFHEVNGTNWTLRDIVLTFSSETRLRKILARNEETNRMARLFLGAHSLDDVLAVLSSKLGPYGIAAALYSRAGDKKKSVREWAKSNAILLVTGRSLFSEAQKPINQAIFRMVSLLLLNEPEQQPKGKTESSEVETPQKEAASASNWIFLDELREIGKLQGYHELANKGRSKGVRMVVGFQNIEGLIVEHREDAANEIASACGHRTFLHTISPKTRNWEADQVGNVVLDETVFSFSQSVGQNNTWSNSTSWKTNRVIRQAMEASDFDQNLKRATPENGLTALNFIPDVGTYVSWVPWNWVLKHVPFPKPELSSETLRQPDEQKLDDWSFQPDLERLHLDPTILDDGSPQNGVGQTDDAKDAAQSDAAKGAAGKKSGKGANKKDRAGDDSEKEGREKVHKHEMGKTKRHDFRK